MTRIATAALIVSCLFFSAPAAAVDGAIQITQAKALAGNVTPTDAPGFPVTITTSGSYVLATNLQAPANRSGIVVKATEVSIDLNGFRINGGGGAAGIGIDGRQRSLTVRNGTVRNFKGDGIKSAGALMLVDNMRIEENGGNGVNNQPNGYARITNDLVFGNSGIGILCGDSCHIEGNTSSSNGNDGVFVFGSGNMVLGNTIYSNDGYGIVSDNTVGFGNNTIVDNHFGTITGPHTALHPNACSPQAC